MPLRTGDKGVGTLFVKKKTARRQLPRWTICAGIPGK